MAQSSPFMKLVEIMAQLREEEGCPWDREQTHKTLCPYLIEETYEVIEAIEKKGVNDLVEELGDLLLQVVFHAQIGTEEGRFTIEDVVGRIHEKLVRRHPHVFGNIQADTSDEVLRNWEAIKLTERSKQSKNKEETDRFPSTFDGVPSSLPALLKAQRVQTKASRVGFDWRKIEEPLKKIREEIDELETAIQRDKPRDIEHELGDLLFSIVNVARHLRVDAEGALRVSVSHFMKRFRYIEKTLNKRGLSVQEANTDIMDTLWEEAKQRD